MRSQKVIKKTAKNNGVSEQHVRQEMQKALDAAWNTTDEAAMKRQKELFPNGKPTLDEFVGKISQIIVGNKS